MDSPRTTSFVLTEAEERKLVDYAIDRVASLRADNSARIKADQLAQKAFDNSREDRQARGGVWVRNNLVLPLTSMICESFTSRAEDDICGELPFYQFRPQGAKDGTLAMEVDNYFKWKFGSEQADLQPKLQDALLATFIRRAAVMKVIWQEDRCEFLDSDTKILHDKTTGNPVRILDAQTGEGKYVSENDPWDESMESDGAGGQVARSKLRADSTVTWDDDLHEFKEPPKALLREKMRYLGANVALLDSDAFLCASNEQSVTKANFKAELYDKTLSYIKTMFLDRPWCRWADYRKSYAQQTATPKTQIQRNAHAENLGFDEKTKAIGLVECWVKRDVLGWGRPQEFQVIIDPLKRKAIFYEFQAKLCPDLKDPYVAIAVAPHCGYWWGYNMPEMLQQFQDYCDLQFNRHSARNARNANPIGMFWPENSEEQPDDLELGDGGLYRGKKTVTDINKFIQWAEIPNLDMDTQELLTFVTEWVQRWLGVSDISQGDYSDVKDNATLGGIKASLANSSKLGRRYERRIRNGYVEIILKMVELQCDQLDRAEVYEVSDGESVELATMTPEQLRGITVHVSLVMGQTVTEEDIKMQTLAKDTVAEYFALAPDVRLASRPIYVKLLTDFGMKDAERLLPKNIPPPPPPDTTKSGVSVSIKGELLSPEQLAAALAEANIKAPIPDQPPEATDGSTAQATPAIPFPPQPNGATGGAP